MAEPQQVALKNPQGEIVTVPADQANDAIGLGFSTTTPEEYQQAVWKAQHETAGQEAKTGLEGFAQGLIPGAPALEEATGLAKPEDIKARAEFNPGIHTAGALAGGVTQAVGLTAATAGLGEAVGLGAEAARAGQLAEEASPALKAAQAVAEGGQDAAEAAAAAGGSPGAVSAAADASALQGPLSAEQAKAVARAKSALSYGEQAVAGAAQGGTGYVNEDELGDHEFNGQAMAAQIGLGALLGVGGEAGINLLGEKVLPPVIRKAGEVMDAAGEKFKAAFTTLSDKVNELAPGTTGKAWEAIFSGAKKPGAKVAEDIADSVDQIGDKLTDIGKSHENSFRPNEAAKNLADVPMQQVAPHIEGFVNTMEQAKSQLSQLAEKNGYAGGLLKKLAGVSDDFVAAAAKAVDAEDGHKALLEAKQRLGDIAFAKGAGVKTGEEALADEAVKRVWGQAADTLKNPEAFGPAQAARNAALDAATRQKINSAKQVAKDFGLHEIDLDSGRNELSMKPSKILAALKADPIASQEKLNHLNEYVEAAKNYIEEVKTSAGTAGAVVPGGDDLHDLLEHLTAQRAAGQAYAPVTDLLKQSRQQTPLGVGAIGAAPLVGGLAHAAGLAIPGATALGVGVAALRSPVKAIQTFAKIASTAATAKQVIGSAVRKTFANEPARVAITQALATPLRGRTIQSTNGVAAGQDFKRQAKHIGELASDQNEQINRLAQNTSRMADVAPNTTAAMHQAAAAGLNILAQNLPRNPAPSLLPAENKEWEPSEPQLQQWNDLHEAILKPQSYLDRIADGTADPDVWPKLQQAYPAWTKEVQDQTMQHLQTHPKLELDDSQKLSASMILGIPISPTVDPAQIAWQQGLFASASQTTNAAGSGKHRGPSQHGLDKLDLGNRSSLMQERKA